MRTVIDLPDEQIATLDRLARAAGTSRAAMIREAVRDLLRRTPAPDVDAAFGLWAGDHENGGEDGLDYQRRLRDGWPA